MGRANPNFTPVKPQGQFGDRKNDGYDRKEGIYYQVFAPENPSMKAQDAVKKLKTDFAGLKKHWDTVTPVSEYHFVFNDKYNGSFVTIETALKEVKKKHNLTECSAFLAKDLENVLFSLADDEILAVIGFIPDPAKITVIDVSVLSEVIDYILRKDNHSILTTNLTAPNFRKKIKFNGLGEQTAALLTGASYQVSIIEQYFSLNSNFAKQELRDTLNEIYIKSKAKKHKAVKGVAKSDVIFFDVHQQICPRKNFGVTNAALLIMSYFFESCDIFEDPGA